MGSLPCPRRYSCLVSWPRTVPRARRAPCHLPQSFSDAEPGENPPQQILAGELAGDLAQGLLRAAQLLGGQFPGTVLGELARGFFGVLACPREGLQVPAAGADRPSIHGLVPHALLQMRAQVLQALAGA